VLVVIAGRTFREREEAPVVRAMIERSARAVYEALAVAIARPGAPVVP
jgi:hypothetical protein